MLGNPKSRHTITDRPNNTLNIVTAVKWNREASCRQSGSSKFFSVKCFAWPNDKCKEICKHIFCFKICWQFLCFIVEDSRMACYVLKNGIKMDDIICSHFKYGYCNFQQYCQKQHVNVICTDISNCDNYFCVKRHPNACKNFARNRYRFKQWAYSHEKNVYQQKFKILKRKLMTAM